MLYPLKQGCSLHSGMQSPRDLERSLSEIPEGHLMVWSASTAPWS